MTTEKKLNEVEAKKPKRIKKRKDRVYRGDIEIISARYGIPRYFMEISTNRIKLGRKITNKNLELKVDPAPYFKKKLRIKVRYDGKTVEKTFSEGEILQF